TTHSRKLLSGFNGSNCSTEQRSVTSIPGMDLGLGCGNCAGPACATSQAQTEAAVNKQNRFRMTISFGRCRESRLPELLPFDQLGQQPWAVVALLRCLVLDPLQGARLPPGDELPAARRTVEETVGRDHQPVLAAIEAEQGAKLLARDGIPEPR